MVSEDQRLPREDMDSQYLSLYWPINLNFKWRYNIGNVGKSVSMVVFKIQWTILLYHTHMYQNASSSKCFNQNSWFVNIN